MTIDLINIISELIQFYSSVQRPQQKKLPIHVNYIQTLYSCSAGHNLQWVSIHKFHDYGMTVEVNRLWDRITIVMKSLEITKKILTSLVKLYHMYM